MVLLQKVRNMSAVLFFEPTHLRFIDNLVFQVHSNYSRMLLSPDELFLRLVNVGLIIVSKAKYLGVILY